MWCGFYVQDGDNFYSKLLNLKSGDGKDFFKKHSFVLGCAACRAAGKATECMHMYVTPQIDSRRIVCRRTAAQATTCPVPSTRRPRQRAGAGPSPLDSQRSPYLTLTAGLWTAFSIHRKGELPAWQSARKHKRIREMMSDQKQVSILTEQKPSAFRTKYQTMFALGQLLAHFAEALYPPDRTTETPEEEAEPAVFFGPPPPPPPPPVPPPGPPPFGPHPKWNEPDVYYVPAPPPGPPPGPPPELPVSDDDGLATIGEGAEQDEGDLGDTTAPPLPAASAANSATFL